MRAKYLLLFILCLFSWTLANATRPAVERCRRLSSETIPGVRPNFIGNGSSFWYAIRTSEGFLYYRVTPSKKKKELLFDTENLSRQLTAFVHEPVTPATLSIREMDFSADGRSLSFEYSRKYFTLDIATGELRVVVPEAPVRNATPRQADNVSPDGRWEAFVKNHNLFIRDKESGKVKQLSSDGETYYSFGRNDTKSSGIEESVNAYWSGDSKFFVVTRQDRRACTRFEIINPLTPYPAMKEYVWEVGGDKNVIQYELFYCTVDSLELKKVDWAGDWKDAFCYLSHVGENSDEIYFIKRNRDYDKQALMRFNPYTKEMLQVFGDTTAPFVNDAFYNVTFLNDGEDILWWSERDGWGHFYLYDKTGRLKKQVTDGSWVSGKILLIDTLGRELYMEGYGREGGNPLYSYVYRVGMDDGKVTLLTPGEGNHHVEISPDRRYIIDTYSRVDLAPRVEVRDMKGRLLVKLEEGDLTELYSKGWRMPEQVVVKAADGMTDLYGVMWKPFDFDSTRVYPVIEYVYPGPQSEYLPVDFSVTNKYCSALAQLGAIVVHIGNRGGNALRGLAYHTYGHGNHRDYALADHKAALEELCNRYSFMDRERIGIFGHSAGGTLAAVAMLTEPDFFKVGVCASGGYDDNIYNKNYVERYVGRLPKGKKYPTVMELASGLKGKMLLVTGSQDDNVHPAQTYRLVDALEKAGKNFDLLELPSERHVYLFQSARYFEDRVLDYFDRHLVQVKPKGNGAELNVKVPDSKALAMRFRDWRLQPNFLPNSDKFWYSVYGDSGRQYYLVDPLAGKKQLLFDNAYLASRMNTLTGDSYDALNLNINQIRFAADGKSFLFSVGIQTFSYDLRTKEVDLSNERLVTTFPSMFDQAKSYKAFSADSSYQTFVKNCNLYCKDRKTKEEFQLTKDGCVDFSYSSNEKVNSKHALEAKSVWLGNTSRFYVLREDNRGLRETYILNSMTDKPKVEKYRFVMPGDKKMPQYELSIYDASTRKGGKVDISRWKDQEVVILGSSKDGSRLYFTREKRTCDELEVCEVDTRNLQTRVLIHEVARPYLNDQLRSISFLNDGEEILFWSERDGWGHYYLYGRDGRLKRQLTSGEWTAGKVLKIDSLKREMYVEAYGYDKNMDPCFVQVLRVSLDKPGVTLLTPEDAYHQVTISPSGYAVDCYSRVDLAPRYVLRDKNGRKVLDLGGLDEDMLERAGWRRPERFKVKAADGVTDLYGVIWRPEDFDSTCRYPLVSYVYPGPQAEPVPKEFSLYSTYVSSLIENGFTVVAMGHRGGSPTRSRAYHTYGYGKLMDYPLADEKYGLEQLFDRYSFIDQTRVGIMGHSGGGFMAVSALCTYPGFFKAALGASGNYDNNIYNRWWGETHSGVKEVVKERKERNKVVRDTVFEFPKVKTPMERVDAIEGKLMLVTGDKDRNVNPAHTYRMMHALIKANKNFEYLLLPGQQHWYQGGGLEYFERRMVDFFKRSL